MSSEDAVATEIESLPVDSPECPPPEPSATPMEVSVAVPSEARQPVGSAVVWKCMICSKGHLLGHCRKFRKFSVEARLRAIVQHRYCARCLSQRHATGQCASSMTCAHCHRDHHTLLHDGQEHSAKRRGRKPPKTQNRILVSPSLRHLLMPTTTNGTVILFPTCQCVLIFGQYRVSIRALLDPCSETSRLSPAVLDQCELHNGQLREGQTVEVVVAPVVRNADRIRVTVVLDSRFKLTTPSAPVPKSALSQFDHLYLADDSAGTPGPIQMVFGGNVYHSIMRPLMLRTPGLPLAQDSTFGWNPVRSLRTLTTFFL